MKSNRFWIFLLGLITALCLGCALLLFLCSSPGSVAQVYWNGKLLHTFPLDEPVEYTLSAPNGGSNTIVVRDGYVCVSHASCPDQVCVNQGWVNTDATPIVCLPNQLVIQVKGGEQDLDAATG
ncbi:MAG: NusG domain II-containing protein [Ruminococcaceae bacterium]|nr:NusG domain II-containing protein [Oscillospiraceae bacterium]